MIKTLYRLFYVTHTLHRGQWCRQYHRATLYDTLDNIKRKYEIYYLTDINGNVIIDNTERYKK